MSRSRDERTRNLSTERVSSAAKSTVLDRGALREFSLLSLLELSNELNVKNDLYAIADVVLFNLMGNFGCSRAAFWLLPEEQAKDAILVRSPGLPEPVARAVGAVWTRWLTNRPAGILEPVLVSELKGLKNVPGLELAEEKQIAIFAPVTSRKEFIGLVALGRRVGGGDFTALDREILQASLNLLGVSIENTSLYNRMVENNRRLRRANDQLKELDELKSEFMRNLNHELRTPLTIVGAYLEMIIDREPEQQKEYLGVVMDQTKKLEGLLLNLLDFSQLMEDELNIDISRGDVTPILKTYFDDRRPGISSELREFRFSAASEVPPAIFDPTRLVQIVDSLVANAVKFCPQGSLVHLRVEPEHLEGTEWVRVDVEDNGPGIPADRLPHIFESFRQGDGSDTREHGGMGVGLALAKKLAEQMDGRLCVETEIGRGAVFTLRLPAA
jgi:signal transduction histidine kinase